MYRRSYQGSKSKRNTEYSSLISDLNNMGINCSSTGASPRPDSAVAMKQDLGSGKDIRSKLKSDENGARPKNHKTKISISDKQMERPKTGEEGIFEMNESSQLGEGNLGLMNEKEVKAMLESNKKKGRLFEDPDFPASTSSLFYSHRSPEELARYTWRRPYELAEDPSIYVDGTSRKDVIQGILGIVTIDTPGSDQICGY